MRILLVSTNRHQYSLCPAPVGLAYLIPKLKEHGHEVSILDLMFSENPLTELRNYIESFDPRAVGFSIRNLDNQNMQNPDSPLVQVKEYIELARTREKITILGGTASSTMPESLLEYMNADFGLIGQGEECLTQLIDAIESSHSIASIPGLVWREHGSIRTNSCLHQGYKGIRADWLSLPLNRYKRFMFPLSIMIKSGCRFNCLYCDTPHIAGSEFQFRDVEDILSEIRNAEISHGIRVFFFADSCFNFPLEYAKNVLRGIVNSGLKIQFYANILPIPGSYDDELFRLYKRAGGVLTSIGGEALSQTMLESYRKPFDLDNIFKCGEIAHRNKMKFGVNLLFGGPGETEATIKETVTNLRKLDFIMCRYGIGIRVLPKTGIFEQAIKEGFITAGDSLLFPKYYFPRNLDPKWVDGFLKKSLRRFRFRKIRLAGVYFQNYLMRR
jgi:radical SAM superfamily enzyme YgiQ (UPF0313 family)